MTFQQVQEAISQLKQTGATVEETLCDDPPQVANLEKTLGLEFPDSLREFYSYYDYLQVGPYEFEWVRNLPDLVDKVRKTLQVPENYVPILWDGMGGYYYVVCSTREGGRPGNFGEVVYRPRGSPKPVESDCGQLFEFLVSRIENAKE